MLVSLKECLGGDAGEEEKESRDGNKGKIGRRGMVGG